MGLTAESTWLGALKNDLLVKDLSPGEIVVALAGNPNTGKSTVFNALTGLRQHTGNWPGKTVVSARGRYKYRRKNFTVVDLPGTYSLQANSAEEEVTRDYICFGRPAVTIVVADATCLERNLNLVLQVLEISSNVVVCVNLIDEAERKRIQIDLSKLAEILGVPVVGTNARDNRGLSDLKEAVYRVAGGMEKLKPKRLCYSPQIEEVVNKVELLFDVGTLKQVDGRWLALKMLEGDSAALDALERRLDMPLGRQKSLRNLLTEEKEKLDLNLQDTVVSAAFHQAEDVVAQVVQYGKPSPERLDRRLDALLTSNRWGFPIMLALLGLVFWLTIAGANIPSNLLAGAFSSLEGQLTALAYTGGWPEWLHGILILGVYRTLTWVISVMLPPMAIFFPLFTLLEDLGYLPRVAFNLDYLFKKARAHGKQALTMCMGFGCNAAGVISCRIIDSPRERLIAVITNNFIPCNGRFPILIALASGFIGVSDGAFDSLAVAGAVLGSVILGFMLTLAVSRFLAATVLKGLPSSFTLELPPYRKPQLGRILIRSILDRTLFVLARAVVVAVPAGLVIWLMANTAMGGSSLLDNAASLLDPFARLIGLDGFILMAFILGLPASEIVFPILIMSYMSVGSMLELDTLEALRRLFIDNGWSWLTAVCTALFALSHFPCATTLLTIRKETQSLKWTFYSFLVPTVTGILVCFIVAQVVRLSGLI